MLSNFSLNGSWVQMNQKKDLNWVVQNVSGLIFFLFIIEIISKIILECICECERAHISQWPNAFKSRSFPVISSQTATVNARPGFRNLDGPRHKNLNIFYNHTSS